MLISNLNSVVIAKQHTQDGSSEDPFLFRTYAQDGNPLEVLNPKEGHKDEIWEAARATSAAPGYFKPIVIRGLKYSDGGMNYNDPTLEVYTDVTCKESVDLVLTIGTGLRPKTRDRAKNILLRPKPISKIHDLLSRMKNSLVDGDACRRHMERLAKDGNFKYYKWDGGEVLGRTKLDVWELAELRRMEYEAEKFLTGQKILEELEACADLLVRKRHARAVQDQDRWRRWAYCTQIQCPYCNKNPYPRTRREAKAHIEKRHPTRLTQSQRQELNEHVENLATIWAWGRGPFHSDGLH